MKNFITGFSVASFKVLYIMCFIVSILMVIISGIACVVLVFTAIGVAFFGTMETALDLFFWSVISFVITVLSYMFFKWLDDLEDYEVRDFAHRFAGQPTW